MNLFYLNAQTTGTCSPDPAATACSNTQNIQLVALTPYESGCFEMTVPFAFEELGNYPNPQQVFNIEFNSIFARIELSGNAVFAQGTEGYTISVDPATNNLTFWNYLDSKTLVWGVYCSQAVGGTMTSHNFPVILQNDEIPFMEVDVIVEPGENFQVNMIYANIMGLHNTATDCEENCCSYPTADNGETKVIPPLCFPDLSINLVGLPAGPVDPHIEVPLTVKIENTGTTPINYNAMDFRIRITDIYDNLPEPTLEPNVNEPPLIESHDGDSHYYYLDQLMTGNTIFPGGVNILAFSIFPPEGLANLLGEAEIEVEYVRIHLEDDTCCEIDVSGATGIVNFPGVHPCDVMATEDITFTVQKHPTPLLLEDCEVGFTVVVNTIAPITVEEILMELQADISGSLMVSEIIPSTSLSCTSVTSCPSANGCLDCGMDNITLSYSSMVSPLTISNGDGFNVVLSGLNGSLDDVEFLKAAIRLQGMGDACIPEIVYDQEFVQSLPLESQCNFCDNITIEAGVYYQPQTLGPDEEGFSIYVNIPQMQDEVTRITVEAIVDNPFDLSLMVNSSFCPGNACPPGQQQSGCLEVNGNTILYQYCPTAIMASGSLPVIDVKFISESEGCIEDVMFTANTEIELMEAGVCNPVQTFNADIFPVCSNHHSFAGSIMTEEGDCVQIDVVADPEEAIYILNEGQCDVQQVATDPCGEYDHSFTCSSMDYTIEPVKDNNHLNGVTTFDMVLITKHIIGVTLLDSPYKIIAADANKSGTVTTLDLVQIRSLILQIINTYPNDQKSWRFVDTNYEFPDPSNPWAEVFPEIIQINNLATGAVDLNFIGIKIGDVNDSALANDLNGNDTKDRSNNSLTFYVQSDLPLKKGTIAKLSFHVENQIDLAAWQLGLAFDAEYLSFQKASSNLSNEVYFGENQTDEGKIKALWYAADGTIRSFEKQEKQFELQFLVLEDIENLSAVLFIDDAVLKSEGYEENGTSLPMELKTDEVVGNSLHPAVFSVHAIPNPFNHQVEFAIEIPQPSEFSFSIYDPTGRMVTYWEGFAEGGLQKIAFDKTSTWPSGLLFYQIQTDNGIYTGKVFKE